MTVAMCLFYDGKLFHYDIQNHTRYYEIKDRVSTQVGRHGMGSAAMIQIALVEEGVSLSAVMQGDNVTLQLGNYRVERADFNQRIVMDEHGKVAVYLTWTDDKIHLVELPKNGEWSLGSGSDDQIQIARPFISAAHCRIVRENGEITVTDLGSGSGLYLNGEPTHQATLREGDVVSICTVQIGWHKSGITFRNVGSALKLVSTPGGGKASGSDRYRKTKMIVLAAAALAAAVLLFGFLLPAWLSTPMTHQYITGGGGHTLAVTENGTVLAAGDGTRFNVSGWKDIVAVSAGGDHTVGLRSDGTVVASGKNDKGQCNVSSFKDIIAISAGREHTVVLRKEGTVAVVGAYDSAQSNVGGWRDIVAISAGHFHTVGLKSDGTVVAVGPGGNHELDVGRWTDIVAISAGYQFTVGLRSDGTVVLAGNSENKDHPLKVSGWKDIVAISAGMYHVVGLKSDGTVVVTGMPGYDGEYGGGRAAVGSWKNIVAISAGYGHTIGLTKSGLVYAIGDNGKKQCDVWDWRDIETP